jgi:LPS sulfotransferase NodH
LARRFVITGAPRTGTTLLVRTLHAIEGVACHGELLNQGVVRGLMDGFEPLLSSREQREARARRLLQQRDRDPVAFIRGVMDSGDGAVGFKMLYQALLDARNQPVTRYLLAQQDVVFIHLQRRNALRRYVSECILRQGGPNHSELGGRSERSLVIRVDIEDFVRHNARLQSHAAAVGALLEGRPVYPVVYETLADDVPGVVSGICRFLGVEVAVAAIQPGLRKVGADDLSEVVSNYRELLGDERTRPWLINRQGDL